MTELGTQDLTENIRGTLQTWQKWGAASPAIASFSHSVLNAQTCWLGVRKIRLMRRLKIEGESLTELNADGPFPDAGCSLEITSLEAQGQPYWTLGLESFGKPDQVVRLLLQAASYFFDKEAQAVLASIPLDIEHSQAYPAWLNHLIYQKA
ncbi:MAG: hypothetical protein HC880_06820 [Bacteroidia bacterium]|nr:hypothetical protein [Bacteroidia bacterium]